MVRTQRRRRLLTHALWSALLFATASWSEPTTPVPVPVPRAAITANELAVIIAQGDPLSEAIGAYYATARGIPPSHVIRIPLPALGQDTMPVADFKFIKSRLDQLLPATVQATLLTWTRPFRVGDRCSMGITSAFALGYDSKYCGVGQLTASVPYYDSDSTHPWQDFGIRPSMMLGANTLAAATALINRGIQSDATYPAGDGYLLRTSDVPRSARYADFMQLPSQWNHPGGLSIKYLDNANAAGLNYLQNTDNILFYFTGLPQVPSLESNHFLPGAIADHLTSFGGVLSPTPPQMPATRWLEAGATGSYGTVEEPYAYPDKFPRASVVIDQYFRGATLIEAYWKSVRRPGEGLFLGEPLARPFADPGISAVVANQYVIATRSFRASAGNANYYIASRDNDTDAWLALAGIRLSNPGSVELRADVPSNPNAAVKLVGPCPDIRIAVNPVQSVKLHGGQAQHALFPFQLLNLAPAGSDCNRVVALTAPGLADGLTARFLTPQGILGNVFLLKPQQGQNVGLFIDVPATLVSEHAAAHHISTLSLTDSATHYTGQAPVHFTIELPAGP